jgi:hypothetical protein
MLDMGIPVGSGTDGTRVASYNPFVSLYWKVSGKTVGGTRLYGDDNRLERMEALRLYTVGSAWFSGDENSKGAIIPGQFADLAILTDDYFQIPEEQIKDLESVLTIMGGRIVYAAEEFSRFSPPPVPVLPEWSPVAHYGGYQNAASRYAPVDTHGLTCSHGSSQPVRHRTSKFEVPAFSIGLWGSACSCWAF